MGERWKTIPDLGAIRESRGITLDQIAQATKIRKYYLRAIEKGEVEKLPQEVYMRSYLRQYARAIDYDEEELLQHFRIPAVVQEDAGRRRKGSAHSGYWTRALELIEQARHLMRSGHANAR